MATPKKHSSEISPPKSNVKYILSAVLIFFILFMIVIVAFYALSSKQKKSNDGVTRYTVGPVISLAQCRSCHNNIDTFSNQNLKFTHWAHFSKSIGCTSCHIEPAHKDGKTSLPPMETCFSCHGLKHSSQGLVAPGNCDTCHPPNFNRVPADHTPDFITSSHKTKSKLKLNNCMLCHSQDVQTKCKICHDQQNVKSNYSDYVYDGRLQPITKPKLQVLIFKKVTKLSQCRPCHTNLNENKPVGLIFDHWKHFSKGIKCASCHRGLVHSKKYKDGIKRPSMQLCFSCHGLGHSKQGSVATLDCRKCHDDSFNLTPSYHTSDWLSLRKPHNNVVDKNIPLFECLTCHQKTKNQVINNMVIESCQNCHSSSQFKERAKPDPIIPASARKTTHQKAHIQKGKNCSLCHDYDSFCRKCHDVKLLVPPQLDNQFKYNAESSPGSHPYNWLGVHKVILRIDQSKKKDCWVCHSNKGFCQKCHHGRIITKADYEISSKRHPKKKIALSQDCSKCHQKKFNLSESTLSKRGDEAKGFHRAHFKQSWFTCRECHPTRKTFKEKDVKFCYGCHNKKQFCTDCHKTEMPHQKNWKAMHSDQIGIIKSAEYCKKCHVGKKFCTDCHHGTLSKGLKGSWFARPPRKSLHPIAINQSGKAACFRCHDAIFCAGCHIRVLGYKP